MINENLSKFGRLQNIKIIFQFMIVDKYRTIGDMTYFKYTTTSIFFYCSNLKLEKNQYDSKNGQDLTIWNKIKLIKKRF